MPFNAKYDSTCPTCGKDVRRGESVIFAAQQDGRRRVVHATCYYTAKAIEHGGGDNPTAPYGDSEPINDADAADAADGQQQPKPNNDGADAADASDGRQPKPSEAKADAVEAEGAEGDGAESQQPQPPPMPPMSDELAKLIAAAVQPHLPAPEAAKAEVDAEQVEAIARRVAAEEAAKVSAPLRVEVHRPDMPAVDVGLVHFRFPELLAAVSTGENVWVAGPAGTGKTMAAEQVAKALGKPFYYCGAIGEPYSLIGFVDANGRAVRTQFRDAYEHGGVFLWDEVDASSPNALLAFSGALANGHCPFPDALVPRHTDCRIIATANTYGHGATSDYVGRSKIDAATLDRFTQLDWPLDAKLEAALCPDKKWLSTVRKVRRACERKGIRVLITPRASIRGAKLLAAGMAEDRVREMVLRRGMTDEQWQSVLAEVA